MQHMPSHSAGICPVFIPSYLKPLSSLLPTVAVKTKNAPSLFVSLGRQRQSYATMPTPTLRCRSSDDATIVLPMHLIRTIELIDADILTSRMHLLALVPAIPLRPPRPHLRLARPMATTISPLRTGLPASVKRAGCLRHDLRLPLKPGRPPLPSSTSCKSDARPPVQ
ncbi:hypothetical protein MVEN_02385000 [Mycena venus]|uniref:Uncharacterized protein n=1 Tax=Mycena venus TaxID=2733690 RepID=A0A8H7CEN0_9AGAR|nr:hypothetical protein MVEN_02385000 [Mycena venus]